MVGKWARTVSLTSSSTSTVQENDKISMMKLYPWLQEFDRLLLETIHVPPTNILELLYHLENNVSAEVTRLKNKPNRATKFLCQFKKRLSSVKLASTMGMNSNRSGVSDQDFYPTYGLIMVHYVNLTLVSSKIGKFGPLHEAKQLFCTLKLIFQEDFEYILDVLLASTLDEHTNEGHLSVGFHLFSFIIEDWRQYSEYYERNTFLLKFCAVASTLFRTSRDGKQFIERNLPSEKIGVIFMIYLSKILRMKFDQRKKIHMFEVVKTIEIITVKSISRSRLVLVSINEILSKPKVNHAAKEKSHAFSDLVVRNIPGTSQPSLSSEARQRRVKHEIEDEFGLNGLLFELDTTGDNNFNSEANDAKNTINILSDKASKECMVSSSSAAASHQRLHMDSDDSNSEVEEDDNQDDEDEQDHVNGNSYFEERCHSEAEMDESGYYQPEYKETMDTGEIRRKNHKVTSSLHKSSPSYIFSYADKKEKSESTKGGKFVRVQSRSSRDSESVKFDGANDSEDEIRPRKSAKPKAPPATKDDSDIEILSEQLNEDTGESDIESASSCSRDEAEAESGEDVVPNYDESSDDEEDETEEETEEKQAEATVPTTKTPQADTLNSTSSSSQLKNQSNNQKGEDDCIGVDTDTQLLETNKENNEEEGEASTKLKVPAQSEDILRGKNGSEMNLRQGTPKTRSSTPQKSTPSPKAIDKNQNQEENNTIQRKDDDRGSSPPKRRRRGIQEESEVDDSSQDQQEETSQTPPPTIGTRARRAAVSRNIAATGTGIGMSTRRTTRAAAIRAKDATRVVTEVGKTSEKGRGRGRGRANK